MRVAGSARRALKTWLPRARDRRRATYHAAGTDTPSRLGPHRYFRPPPPDGLKPFAPQIAALAEHYVAHRFDLLGSGWVRVRHGMRCRGLEGHVYQMGAPVEADPAGEWLRGRINAANVDEARRIWQLVDSDYTHIDWHLDFKSGYRWSEQTWYADIKFGHLPGVDVKVPWELARMQHLPHLVWAYALARSGAPGLAPAPDYARAFRNQVLDFIATNPPRFGVNWTTSMDVGLRVANWLAAYDLFRGYGAEFDDAFEAELARSVSQHARHILANLEWFPALRGNHYLANVVGLLFAAAYLPSTRHTDAWLAFAIRQLVIEVRGQFALSGANFEASTCYHRLSAEMVAYGTALILSLPAERWEALHRYDHRLHTGRPSLPPAPLDLFDLPGSDMQTPFPPWYVERLEKMAEFTLHATKPDGRVAQIGDNDSGRAFKFQPAHELMSVQAAVARYANLEGYAALPGDATYPDEDALDHRALVGAINALFGRDDLGAFGGEDCLETALVRGLSRGTRLPSYRLSGEPAAAERVRVGDEEDWRRWQADLTSEDGFQRQTLVIPLPGDDARAALTLYGYPDFGLYVFRSRRLYLAVRCGPIGQNRHGGHAHNDQLSIELQVDGQDRAADPGTYLYTPLPDRRDAYRSVHAHFAPRVLGSEPGRLGLGLFRLGNEARARCLYFGPRGFVGMHRGYGPPVYRLVAIEANALRIEDVARGGLRLMPIQQMATSGVPFSPGYGKRWRDNPE